jgi:hypothetical protein
MSKTKRLLALILALATVFALFTGVTAFAAEGDEAAATIDEFAEVATDSPYWEAITVLNAAGIITGRDTGKFDPNAEVTRAEAAAIIARMALSKATADRMIDGETGFTDIDAANQFAAGEIAYLAERGAINGRGDGTYDPNGKITGVAVLKILLGTLGYGKADEFTSTLWETNAVSFAAQLGLNDGVESDYSLPATRKDVARYVFNALTQKRVYYVADEKEYYSYESDKATGRPYYEVSGLSRHQTENTATLNDDGYTYVTPYGRLYYRWELAASGKGITSWAPDTANEKLIDTVTVNPQTAVSIQGRLTEVFKVYLNGAVLNTATAEELTALGRAVDSRYTTTEYIFDKTFAQDAVYLVTGTSPYVYGAMADESWTGAKIEIYEQRLSGGGQYNLITGKYEGITGTYDTSEFDGKADKVVVTYDYLGEVSYIGTSAYGPTREIDIYDNESARGRSGVTGKLTATTYGKTYAVGDFVRVIPKLNVGAKGEYTTWRDATVWDYVNNVAIPNQYQNKFNYNTLYGITLLDDAKADTKAITPTHYNYTSSASKAEENAEYAGRYISVTDSTGVVWISGTYQEYYANTNESLYYDGRTYNLYLDQNGYILGGFTAAQSEYVFLTKLDANGAQYSSRWTWASSVSSDPRFITYYDQDQFNVDTKQQISNGSLKSTASAKYPVPVTTIARVWGSHGKVLTTHKDNVGTTLYADAKLYVSVETSYGASTYTALTYSAARDLVNRRTAANKGVKIYNFYDITAVGSSEIAVVVIDVEGTNLYGVSGSYGFTTPEEVEIDSGTSGSTQTLAKTTADDITDAVPAPSAKSATITIELTDKLVGGETVVLIDGEATKKFKITNEAPSDEDGDEDSDAPEEVYIKPTASIDQQLELIKSRISLTTTDWEFGTIANGKLVITALKAGEKTDLPDLDVWVLSAANVPNVDKLTVKVFTGEDSDTTKAEAAYATITIKKPNYALKVGDTITVKYGATSTTFSKTVTLGKADSITNYDVDELAEQIANAVANLLDSTNNKDNGGVGSTWVDNITGSGSTSPIPSGSKVSVDADVITAEGVATGSFEITVEYK